MRKNKKIIRYFLLLIVILLGACSTQKNTPNTRFFHKWTTHYNVLFNGRVSYKTGKKAINDANTDNYSKRLPMFVISNKDVQKTASAQMDKTIEKCRKAIKNHSITVKPKRNKNKWSDPKYKAFYNQKEYNDEVKYAWILIGKSEYHQGKFLESTATFSYIMRHYPKDIDLNNEARMWQARAYAQMDWLYEAQETFDKIKVKTVSSKLSVYYAETKAYLLLEEDKEQEAVPFLEIAAKQSKDKIQRTRYNFILGQIALKNNQKEKANRYFKKVKRAFPTYLMQFNAELNQFSSNTKNTKKAIKGLKRMTRNANNKDYLDQIWGTIGDIYIQKPDTTNALIAYKKAVELSTRNGSDKARILLELGKIYYQQKKYGLAQPYYQEVSQLMDNTDPEYATISRLSEHLDALATQQEIVHMQDSLQSLSKLPEQEQIAIIEEVIKDKLAAEEAAKKAAEDAKALAVANAAGNMNGTNLPQMPGMGMRSNDWYFYNDALKKAGLKQFQQKFGVRKLEDNWRRINKVNNFNSMTDEETSETDDALNDSTRQDAQDENKPAFYLAQLLKTPQDYLLSDSLIADALYQMAGVYKDDLKDYPSALNTYHTFQNRFTKHKLRPDSYYSCYRMHENLKQQKKAEATKKSLIDQYPDSKYALILSTPDYVKTMQQMFALQDSIYQSTYLAYEKTEYTTVRENYSLMQNDYPLSDLMPKFAFLEALTYGRTGQKERFSQQLEALIKQYPNSDVTPISKDMLALIGQGRKAKNNAGVASINTKRTQGQSPKDTVPVHFTIDEIGNYLCVIIPQNTVDSLNDQLLYDIAAYNFTKFMIKGFDLKLSKVENQTAIIITPLMGLKESLWYLDRIENEPSLQLRLTEYNCHTLIISENNWQLILSGELSLTDYLTFCDKQNIKHKTR